MNRHWRPTETIYHLHNFGRYPCEEEGVEGAENATFPSKEEQDFDVVDHHLVTRPFVISVH